MAPKVFCPFQIGLGILCIGELDRFETTATGCAVKQEMTTEPKADRNMDDGSIEQRRGYGE